MKKLAVIAGPMALHAISASVRTVAAKTRNDLL